MKCQTGGRIVRDVKPLWRCVSDLSHGRARRSALPRMLMLALGVFAAAPSLGHGGVLFSAMAYGGFSFASSDVAASVDWVLPWYGELDAEVADSTPAAEAIGLKPEGNSLSLAVEAETLHGLAYAEYVVSDGAHVSAAADPGTVSGYVDTQISLGDLDAWAYGYAGGYFENRFRVIGGIPGASVPVSFQLAWSREFEVDVGAGIGRWELLNGIFLSLYNPATKELLAESTMTVAQAGFGPSYSVDAGSSGLLGVSAVLEYGRDYVLYGAADARVQADTPATGALLLAGLIGLRLSRTRRRSVASRWNARPNARRWTGHA